MSGVTLQCEVPRFKHFKHPIFISAGRMIYRTRIDIIEACFVPFVNIAGLASISHDIFEYRRSEIGQRYACDLPVGIDLGEILAGADCGCCRNGRKEFSLSCAHAALLSALTTFKGL